MCYPHTSTKQILWCLMLTNHVLVKDIKYIQHVKRTYKNVCYYFQCLPESIMEQNIVNEYVAYYTQSYTGAWLSKLPSTGVRVYTADWVMCTWTLGNTHIVRFLHTWCTAWGLVPEPHLMLLTKCTTIPRVSSTHKIAVFLLNISSGCMPRWGATFTKEPFYWLWVAILKLRISIF